MFRMLAYFKTFLNVENYYSWFWNSGFRHLLIRKLGKIYFFIKHYFPRKFFLVFENHEMQPTILLQRVATLMEVLFFLPQKMGLHFSHHLQQASTHKFSASYSLLPPLFSTKKSKTNFITYPICYSVKNLVSKLETPSDEIQTCAMKLGSKSFNCFLMFHFLDKMLF